MRPVEPELWRAIVTYAGHLGGQACQPDHPLMQYVTVYNRMGKPIATILARGDRPWLCGEERLANHGDIFLPRGLGDSRPRKLNWARGNVLNRSSWEWHRGQAPSMREMMRHTRRTGWNAPLPPAQVVVEDRPHNALIDGPESLAAGVRESRDS